MALVQQKADSVYDFFYVDTRRIAQLLSQFGADGLLSELTRTAEETSETSASLNAGVAKGDYKGTGKSGLSRRFDPQWLLPLKFLDAVEDIIHRRPAEARIGQIVLMKGSMWLVDLSIMKGLLDQGVIKKSIKISTNTRSSARQSKNEDDLLALGMSVVSSIPHGIQLRMQSENNSYWASVAYEGLTTKPNDVFLMHGLRISGDWVMVGLLDAVPDPVEEPHIKEMRKSADEATLGLYAGALASMLPIIRPMMGRPENAYGVTPLLIFREVPE